MRGDACVRRSACTADCQLVSAVTRFATLDNEVRLRESRGVCFERFGDVLDALRRRPSTATVATRRNRTFERGTDVGGRRMVILTADSFTTYSK